MTFISVRGPFLYVGFWRIQTSESDVYKRQILTYKDSLRTERDKPLREIISISRIVAYTQYLWTVRCYTRYI